MAHDHFLADRIREFLVDLPQVEEKQMMGGLVFMVNDKMCLGVFKDDMMVRIDPDKYEGTLGKQGCHPMDFTGKTMKGYVLVSPEGITRLAELEYWINLAIYFNSQAKNTLRKRQKYEKQKKNSYHSFSNADCGYRKFLQNIFCRLRYTNS